MHICLATDIDKSGIEKQHVRVIFVALNHGIYFIFVLLCNYQAWDAANHFKEHVLCSINLYQVSYRNRFQVTFILV